MKTFDVFVPCYRYGGYLRQCVESVLGQSHENLRVLIIDDASPDETPEVGTQLATEDSRIEYVRHTVNRGHINTYNEGLDWASGDYLLLLSADDLLLPGALARAAALFEAHPDVVMTYGACIDLKGDTLPSRLETAEADVRWTVMSGTEFITISGARNIVPTPTAIIRTSVQKQVGGYRHDLPHTGDMEMWFRLAAYGQIGRIHACQAVYRLHDRNMAKDFVIRLLPDFEQRRMAITLFLAEHSQRFPNPKFIREFLENSLAKEAINCARHLFMRNEVAACEQLVEFALIIDPEIRSSAEWSRLAWTRQVNPKIWSVVQPTINFVRNVPWLSKPAVAEIRSGAG